MLSPASGGRAFLARAACAIDFAGAAQQRREATAVERFPAGGNGIMSNRGETRLRAAVAAR